MSRRSRSTVLGLLLGGALLAACDQAREPLAPGAPRPRASVGALPGWSAPTQKELKKLLESEKARVAQEQTRSQADYDAAKLQWEQFLRSGKSQTGEALLACDPLQYAGSAQIVGPAGGDISVGPHKLSIPRGALTQFTVITAEMPVSLSVGVRLSPHGLEFARQPTLTLSYKHCRLASHDPFGLVYVDDGDRILEQRTAQDAQSTGLVSAGISHFSKYKVSTRWALAQR